MVIGDHQHFKGYTLFLCKNHETELHFLPKEIKAKFLSEMALVAETVYIAFSPEKMNYELLGMGDAHLHWHLFPRRVNGPVWWLSKEEMYNDENRPSLEALEGMKKQLLYALDKVLESTLT